MTPLSIDVCRLSMSSLSTCNGWCFFFLHSKHINTIYKFRRLGCLWVSLKYWMRPLTRGMWTEGLKLTSSVASMECMHGRCQVHCNWEGGWCGRELHIMMKILDHATQGFNVCSSCHAAKLIQVVLNAMRRNWYK
jgi:hypothetical protein